MVTLSRWERDLVYPTWAHQPAIAEYLGYDPFTNPAEGRPKGNETSGVASLTSTSPGNLGQALRNYRLKHRKNQKEFAKVLGVTPKTLRGWELGAHRPSRGWLESLSKLV